MLLFQKLLNPLLFASAPPLNNHLYCQTPPQTERRRRPDNTAFNEITNKKKSQSENTNCCVQKKTPQRCDNGRFRGGGKRVKLVTCGSGSRSWKRLFTTNRSPVPFLGTHWKLCELFQPFSVGNGLLGFFLGEGWRFSKKNGEGKEAAGWEMMSLALWELDRKCITSLKLTFSPLKMDG